MNKAFIYGHHFKYLRSLISNPTMYVMYEYLFDELYEMCRETNNYAIPIRLDNKSQIASQTGVNRKTVQVILDNLQLAKLINIDDDKCQIDIPFCLSVLNAYCRLKNKTDREIFSESMKAGDINSLRDMGFSMIEDDWENFLNMKGTPLPNCITVGENFPEVGKISQMCPKSPKCEKNYPGVSEITQMCPKLPTSEENLSDVSKISHKWEKLPNSVQNLPTLGDNCQDGASTASVGQELPIVGKNSQSWEELATNNRFIMSFSTQFINMIHENFTKESFNDAFDDVIMMFCQTEDERKSFVDRFWEHDYDACFPLLFCLALKVGKISHKGVQNLPALIIYNIKQQEEELFYNVTSLSRKISNQEKVVTFLSSTAERKDNQKKEGYTENSRFPSGLGHVEILPLGNFPDDEQEGKGETDEDVDKSSERRRRLRERASTSQDPIDKKYELIRKRRRLPYFPAEEMKEILTNLSACLDRVDKIFINQVWEILKELFAEDVYDEDGNYTGEKEVSPEGKLFEKDRLYRDVLKPAYESVLDIFEKGGVEYKGVLLPVTSKDKPYPEMVDLIIDWEESAGLEEVYYKITSATFHNIYAEEVKEIRIDRSVARKYRYRDIEYTRKILEMMTREKNKPGILTPAEYAVGRFLMDNFNITDTFDPIVPKNKYAGRDYNRFFFSEIKRFGISKEDFLGLLFREKLSENETIYLGFRMFFSKYIENWNRKHVFKSAINIPEIVEWSDEQIAAYDKIVAVAEEEAEKEEKRRQEAKRKAEEEADNKYKGNNPPEASE